MRTDAQHASFYSHTEGNERNRVEKKNGKKEEHCLHSRLDRCLAEMPTWAISA